MKFNKISILAAAMLAFAFTSMGQGIGGDTFKAVRTLVLSFPQNIVAGTSVVTNGPIDKALLNGVGQIDFLTFTNNPATVLTATLYGSADQTNWVSLPTYALVTNTTSVVITNEYWGGTNLLATNFEVNPFTTTYPTAASAGYATPYPAEGTGGVFTNTGAITISGAYRVVQVGVNLTDLQRYLEVVYAASGTGTNITPTAILIAPK